ncbi:MAG TPA: hypothetical protein VFV00_10335 [Acidimicrobiales bacterium]|nr:hypothetical protein [Acidimicrobiales bacterium]
MAEEFEPPAPTAGDAAAASEASRYQRLAEGVRSLRTGGGTLNLNERILMVIGGIIAPLGLVIVVIGWYGAAHSPFLFQQVPYLISGLGIGLGLVFLGSFFYFAHWITELVKESRAQSAAMIEAIGRLEETVRQQAGTERLAAATVVADGSAAASTNGDLVATGKGTMAHRPDCVVVAGKRGLRAVSADDGLASCKLCDPYASDVVETSTP